MIAMRMSPPAPGDVLALLEDAGQILVIRRPDRWHIVNHGYATTGR
jgi:hypothetical protein